MLTTYKHIPHAFPSHTAKRLPLYSPFEIMTEGARVHARHSGNFIQFKVTGVVIVYKGNDFINPLVPQRRKLFVIMQTCQPSLRTASQLRNKSSNYYLMKTT